MSSRFGLDRKLCFCIWVGLAAATWGQTVKPQIGYLFPAGGQRGTSFQIAIGGQVLRQATDVYVSGDGVQAQIARYIRPLRNINGDQRKLLEKSLKEVRDLRLAELKGTDGSRTGAGKRKRQPKKESTKAEEEPEVKMPEHPLLDNLEEKSLRELAHIRSILFFPRSKLQINRQIAEIVLVNIVIDKDAKPGLRELRVVTKNGMTNPVTFQVGLLPERRELEPNDEEAYPTLSNLPRGTKLPKEKPLSLPIVLNGQIMPGDVDRFRFQAKAGQKLVIQAHARSLIPYLADAVPGWFQAVVTLYDAQGKEVAYADDYRFDPDPVLFYEIRKGGEYEVAIRDSIYRGREDFIYRISVSEQPFITQAFPLGGRMGIDTDVSIRGWNLPEDRLSLDMRRGEDGIRKMSYYRENTLSNPVTYAVNILPESLDRESKGKTEVPQAIEMPRIINGRIDRPGDVDVFRIRGRAGDTIVAEVYARRLNTPLDSVVQIKDADGKVVAWNDDYVLKESHLHKDVMGLVTHHADSYVLTELSEDGFYDVCLTDAQRHGGDAYAYRIRISRARPDFMLRVTPSHFQVRAGGILPITVYALRKDGFDGEILLTIKNAPFGFELKGGRIPAGQDSVRLTLTAPPKGFDHPVPIELEGHARLGKRHIRRRIVPAEDTMQAFLYRHLVPADELLVNVQKSKWRMPAVELLGHGKVLIPEGGASQVRVKARVGKSTLKEVRLELKDPPKGVTLHDVQPTANGWAFRVRADREHCPKSFADNLIVEAIREYFPKDKNGKVSKRKRTYSMGYLPAIPFEIVN